MMLLGFSLLGLLCAALPAVLFPVNLRAFRDPLAAGDDPLATGRPDSEPRVSVLIPARDEADGIAACVQAALASEGVHVEVLVLDDHSSDATAQIVAEIAGRDRRVRCLPGAPLPAGWNGKQHACDQLARVASFDRWVFLDADVRLRCRALRDLVRYQRSGGIDLLSAFPHQQTGTPLETLLIPMMHFLLLGFLPIRRMRQHRGAAYAAGCGQLFLTTASAYRQSGGHAAIRRSRHDGLALPRAYRLAGLATDVVDGTALATCRMYRGAGAVVRGLLKNATEGVAHRKRIVPLSILLLSGSLLPWATLLVAIATQQTAPAAVSLLALVASHLPRSLAVRRFGQPAWGAAAHTLAVTLFVALQWIALWIELSGRRIAWRGRVES